MSNVRSISCPSMHLTMRVGKGYTLWSGKDSLGMARLWRLTQFLEVCMGREIVYHAEEGNFARVDDCVFLEFDHNRDYTCNPVTAEELALEALG